MRFSGQVVGDAALEVRVTEERGAIALGGRVTEKGALANPIRRASQLVDETQVWRSELSQ